MEKDDKKLTKIYAAIICAMWLTLVLWIAAIDKYTTIVLTDADSGQVLARLESTGKGLEPSPIQV
jgi:hypothetical protein